MSEFLIQTGTIDDAIKTSLSIPEFKNPYTEKEYLKRLENKVHLILIAKIDKQMAGFKVGYAKENHTFYSWLGGVLPKYRKKGIANALMEAQENWARKKHFQLIEIKTRNCFKAMLIFSLKQNYFIKDVEKKDNPEQNRIILQKKI